MENTHASFLGTGWSFPPEFTDGGRDILLVSGPDDIRQSLEILLGTRLHERILQEDYGSPLQDFLFEETSEGLVNQLKNTLAEAILYHEPRVELNSIELEADGQQDGLLYILLDYSLPASNTRFNMVYPFYLREASV